MMMQDKVVFVSGAAKGIGRACAERFVAEGARVWLSDIDAPALEEVLTALGSDADGMAGDGSSSAFVADWVAAGVDRYGAVDALYNNVGVARPGLIGDLTDDDWDFNLRLNVSSCFFATREVLPHMVAAGRGAIVSMSSGAGIGGHGNLGGYAAAKAGVISLMETVAMEYGRHGVRANAVTPGPTATAPLLAYIEQRPGGVPAHTADLDLGRLTEPTEVANTVVWLASDLASSVTGICVRNNIRGAARIPEIPDGTSTKS